MTGAAVWSNRPYDPSPKMPARLASCPDKPLTRTQDYKRYETTSLFAVLDRRFFVHAFNRRSHIQYTHRTYYPVYKTLARFG